MGDAVVWSKWNAGDDSINNKIEEMENEGYELERVTTTAIGARILTRIVFKKYYYLINWNTGCVGKLAKKAGMQARKEIEERNR